MTDWQKAREAAIEAACDKWDETFKPVFNAGSMVQAVDAALSAFEKAGYFVIGIDELRVLLRKGSTALERYESKYAAVLEERK